MYRNIELHLPMDAAEDGGKLVLVGPSGRLEGPIVHSILKAAGLEGEDEVILRMAVTDTEDDTEEFEGS